MSNKHGNFNNSITQISTYAKLVELVDTGHAADGVYTISSFNNAIFTVKNGKIVAPSSFASITDFEAAGGMVANPGPAWIGDKLTRNGFDYLLPLKTEINRNRNNGVNNWSAATGITKIIDISSMSDVNSGDGFTANYNNCSASIVDDDFIFGGKALKLTHTAGTSNIYANFLLTTFPKTTATRKEIGVWIKFDDWSKVSILAIWAGTSGLGTEDHLYSTISNSGPHQNNGWRFFSFYSSTPATSSIVNIRISISTTGNTSGVNYSIGPVYADIKQANTFCFTFDDGYAEHYYHAASLLESYGFRGTFNIIGSVVGTDSAMSKTQLRDLVSRGHDLGVHGLYALSTYASNAEAYADIELNYNFLVDNIGIIPNSYTFPNGVIRSWDTDFTFLESLGIKLARGVGNNAPSSTALPQFFINQKPNYIAALNVGWDAAVMNTTQFLANVDANIAIKSQQVSMFHQIDVGSASSGQRISLTDLDTIIAGIKARSDAGSLKVMTFKELAEGYV